MIKKYKDYIKESLLDKLKGPSKEEVLQHFIDEQDEDGLLLHAIKFSSVEHILIALEMGADEIEMLKYIIFDYKDLTLLEKLLSRFDINSVYNDDLIGILLKGMNIEYKEVIFNHLTKISIYKDLIIDCAVNNNVRTFEMIFDKHLSGINYNEVLVKASEHGSHKIIDLLLKSSDVDIHYNDDEALYMAVYEGRTSIAKILIENGADIYAHKGRIIDLVKVCDKKGYCTDMVKLIKEKDTLNKL